MRLLQIRQRQSGDCNLCHDGSLPKRLAQTEAWLRLLRSTDRNSYHVETGCVRILDHPGLLDIFGSSQHVPPHPCGDALCVWEHGVQQNCFGDCKVHEIDGHRSGFVSYCSVGCKAEYSSDYERTLHIGPGYAIFFLVVMETLVLCFADVDDTLDGDGRRTARYLLTQPRQLEEHGWEFAGISPQ